MTPKFESAYSRLLTDRYRLDFLEWHRLLLEMGPEDRDKFGRLWYIYQDITEYARFELINLMRSGERLERRNSPRFLLRSDAAHFILSNIHDMVVIPIALAQVADENVPDANDVREAVRSDIQTLFRLSCEHVLRTGSFEGLLLGLRDNLQNLPLFGRPGPPPKDYKSGSSGKGTYNLSVAHNDLRKNLPWECLTNLRRLLVLFDDPTSISNPNPTIQAIKSEINPDYLPIDDSVISQLSEQRNRQLLVGLNQGIRGILNVKGSIELPQTMTISAHHVLEVCGEHWNEFKIASFHLWGGEDEYA